MLTRRLSLEAATFDLSSGRLWATAALATLTIRTAWALGRAVHSAGLAGPLPWPNDRDFVTTRYTLQHQLAAQCTWVSRRPLYVTYVTRDRATGHGVGSNDDWSRISHLGPSESVGHERSADVQ